MAVVATVAAATGAAASGAPAQAATHAAAGHRSGTTAACRPLGTAAAWSARLRSLGGRWAGADGAASVRLPDGRSLWFFGDTVQGTLTSVTAAGQTTTGVRDWRMAHNTMVTTRDSTCAPIRIHTGPRGSSLLPDRGAHDVHWPTAAVVDGGRLWVFAGQVYLDGSQFRGHGTRLAVMSFRGRAGRPAPPRFRRWYPTPSTGVDELRGVQWGAAVEKHRGFVYVYGTRHIVQPYVFGKALYVARVPAGRLAVRSAWRFWNGRAWVTGQGRAAEIRPAAGGVSTTLSVDVVGGRWLAVTKKDEFLGDKIVALTAPHPYGPWREQVLATTDTERDAANGDITYTALSHPDIRLRSGRLMVTVSRNNLDFTKVVADVERGRPSFLEVAWPAR